MVVVEPAADSSPPGDTRGSGGAAGFSRDKADPDPNPDETMRDSGEEISDDAIIYERGCFELGVNRRRFIAAKMGMNRSMTREVRPAELYGGDTDGDRADIRLCREA